MGVYAGVMGDLVDVAHAYPVPHVFVMSAHEDGHLRSGEKPVGVPHPGGLHEGFDVGLCATLRLHRKLVNLRNAGVGLIDRLTGGAVGDLELGIASIADLVVSAWFVKNIAARSACVMSVRVFMRTMKSS